MLGQPIDCAQVPDNLVPVAIAVHGNEQRFKANAARVGVGFRLFWLRAERICRIEHVVDVGTFQQLAERLVGSTVRDSEFQSVLQHQKLGVKTGNLVGIRTDEPVQLVFEIARSRAESVFGAARANAKRIDGGDRKSKEEGARAYHPPATIRLIWSQRGLPRQQGLGSSLKGRFGHYALLFAARQSQASGFSSRGGTRGTEACLGRSASFAVGGKYFRIVCSSNVQISSAISTSDVFSIADADASIRSSRMHHWYPRLSMSRCARVK
jgi:hypothetical protein